MLLPRSNSGLFLYPLCPMALLLLHSCPMVTLDINYPSYTLNSELYLRRQNKMKRGLSVFFFLFALSGFLGWLWSFLSRSLGCSYSIFCMGADQLLGTVGNMFGDIAFIIYSVLWNTSFMPHSSPTQYSEWIAALINLCLLVTSIFLLKRVFK